MPYKTVTAAEKAIPSIKNLSAEQKKVFLSVFNDLVNGGESEDSAIPKAIAAAKKVNKSFDNPKHTDPVNIDSVGASGEISEDNRLKIEKVLNRDKERVVQEALRAKFKDEDGYPYVIEIDTDKGEVYFEMWSEATGYVNWMCGVSFNSNFTKATITSDPVRVVSQTEYKPVSEDSIVAKVIKGITEHFTGTKRSADPVESAPVIKQFDESNDQMIEIGQMYCTAMDVDAHDDAMTLEDVYKMVDNFNEANAKGIVKGNIDHTETTDKFSFIKAWVTECDCSIGGHFVPEGTPLIKAQYHDAYLWKERKEGGYTGWSIGAKARSVEYIEIEVDDE